MEINGKPKDDLMKCKECEFETTSKHGLKTHMTRKHTKFDKESFPKQCDLCSKTFENIEDLEKHVITHSYKSKDHLQFKCNECDFWCPNSVSIEAHIKKFHSENVTCGICDFKAETIEKLDTHVHTCQIYKGCCKEIYRSIPDFKEHINNIHKGGRWLIKHICIDPNNPEFLLETTHYSDQLFRKRKL